MSKRERGYVLLHVLVTTIVVVFIAAGLAQMLMARYAASQRLMQGAGARLQNQASLDRVITDWVKANQSCVAVAGYTCSGCGTQTCDLYPSGCTCTVGQSDPGKCPGIIHASCPVGAPCNVTITSCP